MRQTIAIAGLGLIGGSLALALKANTACTVIGIDRRQEVQEAALAAGAVDRTGAAALPAAELLILALPPAAAAPFLREHAPSLKKGTLVTDVCGVKRAVVAACEPLCREHGLVFLGGHPMAGKETSGFESADAALFRGASYILTPAPDTPVWAEERMRELAAALGCARVTVSTPEEHDRMIAFTSQLPHVLAGAYVKSPCCPKHAGFSAGSYRDVSRVAAVDEKLWTQLFLLNADELCREIDTLIGHLHACRDAVASGDPARLEPVLREGRLRKESVKP
ncbi:MAG TPA: prephenate dehydrogenase [Firmicutes bacterium]|nr:prephenate dehydrogenase [Bacillota bacterium]